MIYRDMSILTNHRIVKRDPIRMIILGANESQQFFHWLPLYKSIKILGDKNQHITNLRDCVARASEEEAGVAGPMISTVVGSSPRIVGFLPSDSQARVLEGPKFWGNRQTQKKKRWQETARQRKMIDICELPFFQHIIQFFFFCELPFLEDFRELPFLGDFCELPFQGYFHELHDRSARGGASFLFLF